MKLSKANAMDSAQQKDTIRRIVRTVESHNKDKHHADEAKKILEQLRDFQANFDVWGIKLLAILVYNR